MPPQDRCEPGGDAYREHRRLDRSQSFALQGDLRRLSTAYHEAGHVVAARTLGFAVRRVSIARRDNFLGITRFDEGQTRELASACAGGDFAPDLRDIAEWYLIVVLAGPAAQKRHTGQDNIVGAGGDLDIATDLLLAMTRDARQAADCFQRLRYRAEALVEEEWARIILLADALYEETTLEEDRLQAVLESPGD